MAFLERKHPEASLVVAPELSFRRPFGFLHIEFSIGANCTHIKYDSAGFTLFGRWNEVKREVEPVKVLANGNTKQINSRQDTSGHHVVAIVSGLDVYIRDGFNTYQEADLTRVMQSWLENHPDLAKQGKNGRNSAEQADSL